MFPGKYAVLITSLPIDAFYLDKLKYLYFLRWGIETSFRSLKYIIDLLYFRSKKLGHIIQEIFAKLTMYNFTELIAVSISINNALRKYFYTINFSAAANVCRKFSVLRTSLKLLFKSIFFSLALFLTSQDCFILACRQFHLQGSIISTFFNMIFSYWYLVGLFVLLSMKNSDENLFSTTFLPFHFLLT